MQRLTKSVDVKVDAADNGSITGYASTFTREPDWAGDVVAKGAFADWLDAYRAGGSTLPLLYNHDQSLDSFIGRVTDIREDDRGLLFTAEFDATEKAQRARELAMDGRLAKFSFAYVVREQGTVTLDDGREANELRRLDVDEVSLVLTPCNPDTSVVEVKGAETQNIDLRPRIEGLTDEQREEFTKAIAEATHNGLAIGLKAGRRNSKADEDELRAVRALLDECSAKVDALIGDEQADDADDGDTPDADDITDTKSGADETDQPTEGGEGDATPKGRDVEQVRLDAYKGAILRKHQTKKEGNYA